MEMASHQFRQRAREAIDDATLQQALSNITGTLQPKRTEAVAGLPEFDSLRDHAVAIKQHTLDHLSDYLEKFESQVLDNGGYIHWCADADTARQTVLNLCRQYDARSVTKGKSMVTEELELNRFLDKHGILPLETDLGEYIIQLRDEAPSHIIAPAVHLNRQQVAETFRQAHDKLDPARPMESAENLTEEARNQLREEYGRADIGITGANFLIAETGSTIIVTNEGNGDLTQTMAKVHIVVTSIEKLVPTLEDAGVLLRLLARSATGQDMSVYTTLSSGPKRKHDLDGPEAFHVVLVDNGRSAMLDSSEREMLRCIRCSACLNHCPVYNAVGGHAYGWVYSGPMGKVMTPSLAGGLHQQTPAAMAETADLPNASSFCGRCQEVCPMRIPLPALMRNLRQKQTDQGITPLKQRLLMQAWASLASRPRLYAIARNIATGMLARLAGKNAAVRRLPFGLNMMFAGWCRGRDLPVPQPGGFQAALKSRNRSTGKPR